MKKWYVFDSYDCFGHYDTLEAASAQAAWLIAGEFTGVEIRHLTKEEFEHYCQFG